MMDRVDFAGVQPVSCETQPRLLVELYSPASVSVMMRPAVGLVR